MNWGEIASIMSTVLNIIRCNATMLVNKLNNITFTGLEKLWTRNQTGQF